MKHLPKTKALTKKRRTARVLAVIVVAAIAAIGVKLLVSSHAATPYAAAYAANGSLGGAAALTSGGSNAKNQAVQFGSPPAGAKPVMPATAPSGYTRLFTGTFPTNAPVGQFDNIYGSQWGEYTGPAPQPDGSQAAYNPSEVLSVSNGSLFYNLHTDSSGTAVAAAPQVDNYAGFLYGQVGLAVKLDSESGPQGYKIAFLMWPTSGSWTNEVDFAETQTNFAQDFAVSSLLTNDSPNFSSLDNGDTGVNLMDNKYHVFLVTWTPTALTVSIDGVTKATFPASSGADPAQQMRVSLQAEGQLGGNTSISPASQATIEVPWVYINTMN